MGTRGHSGVTASLERVSELEGKDLNLEET